MFRYLAEPRNILAEPRLKNTALKSRETQMRAEKLNLNVELVFLPRDCKKITIVSFSLHQKVILIIFVCK
jgi:hypothetical protein